MATYTLPSAVLRRRVSGNTDTEVYLQFGLDAATCLTETARSFANRDIIDVLDWGCGPGRVAMHIPDVQPNISLNGCDPDADAISWAQQNLRGQFSVSELYPPLPYEDESFDAVFGLSVMTHLRRTCQLQWLREIKRVLRPGGVFLATIHGKAASHAFGVTDVRDLDDRYLDPFMAGVLPADYYRTVLQTESYTKSAWSTPEFQVIGYGEEILGAHDLVVCSKV